MNLKLVSFMLFFVFCAVPGFNATKAPEIKRDVCTFEYVEFVSWYSVVRINKTYFVILPMNTSKPKVGDSYHYVITEGTIQLITEDHKVYLEYDLGQGYTEMKEAIEALNAELEEHCITCFTEDNPYDYSPTIIMGGSNI